MRWVEARLTLHSVLLMTEPPTARADPADDDEANSGIRVLPHVPVDYGTTTRLYLNGPRGIMRGSFAWTRFETCSS
jgi:hypothetical protein